MITKEEIKKIALEKGLEGNQIEKDYVLGWILAGISQNENLSKTWIFKGGTCIRKCLIEDYRYSEDLDFTIQSKIEPDTSAIQNSLNDVCNWVTEKSGIEIDLNRSLFESVTNISNQLIIQGRIFYEGC